MNRRVKLLALSTALTAALLTAVPSVAGVPAGCIDLDGVVNAESTSTILGLEGKYTLPTSTPKALVVFAHGYGHRSESWVGHLTEAANRGAVAVAMDYTGTGPAPDNRGMPLMAGAADTVSAAQYFASSCGLSEVYLLGVSMGGAVSGLALAEGPSGLFDYWIDVEGMTNVSETYAEASLVAKSNNAYAVQAAEDITTETGGLGPELVRRTVVARVADIKASGLKGAFVVHAVNDGLVPYNQGVEMASALRAALIPTDFITVGRRSSGETGPDGAPGTDRNDTTATSYVIDRSSFNEFDGHGSERSSTHTVIKTGLSRVWALLDSLEVPTGRTSWVDQGSTVTAP